MLETQTQVDRSATDPSNRLEPVFAWLKAHTRAVLALGVAFQLIVLLTMIVLPTKTLRHGQKILLHVVLVDSRDLVRGDVILSYSFSRIPPNELSKLRSQLGLSQIDTLAGHTLFVSLVADENAQYHYATSYTLEQPNDGLFLRGTVVNYDRVAFGIESYFVQEGTGGKYEQAARTGTLSAEAVVDSQGNAVLTGLVIK